MAPKSKTDNTHLGRAIINRKARDIRTVQESGLYTTNVDPTSQLKSITQEGDLDAFLNTAQLAGRDFTAEHRNVKIIHSGPTATQDSYLLSDQEEREALQKHVDNKLRLRVPRRPPWTKATTMTQLERQEKDAFLQWRRDLAELQERDRLLLTPFERNIEVWRQLWRVLERSQLIVQIVDARNPLRFRCEDLEHYVQDLEGPEGEQGTGKGLRKNLLLINKSDLLTTKQRRKWADYFDSQGVSYAFFSAANAAALQALRQDATSKATNEESKEDANESEIDTSDTTLSEMQSQEDSTITEDSEEPRIKVLSVLELEELFISRAPDLSCFKNATGGYPQYLTVGLVGYPNVGKSSTINALLGEKKVSVSSTPGKTKHFQTIVLSNSITLCDCPGLVFPQFATTRADLVCDGVLPIDQLRERIGPISLVAKRIPKKVLELTYGLSLQADGLDDIENTQPNARELLAVFATSRGFARTGQGNPDETRAARLILKDYVNAKLLFCHPPPGTSPDEFNKETNLLSLDKHSGKRRVAVTSQQDEGDHKTKASVGIREGLISRNIDGEFFEGDASLASRPFVKGGHEFTRSTKYPHQNAVTNNGTTLSGRNARIASVLANAEGAHPGKKHHKKDKRMKQRSGQGYEL